MVKSRTTNRRKADIQRTSVARQRREAAKEAVQRRQKRRERKIVRKKVNPLLDSHFNSNFFF